MSDHHEVEAEPSTAPFELEPVDELTDQSNSNYDHSNQFQTEDQHPQPDEPDELNEEFQSVSLDQNEAHLNNCHSPSLQHSFSPTSSDSHSHSHSHPSPNQTQSATTLTDDSLSPTTQPSSTHSVDQDGSTAIVDSQPGPAKADAEPQPQPVEPGPTGPTPGPSPQPKPKSSAPTPMQKVVSLTRQRDLPPKSKEEEVSKSVRSPHSPASATRILSEADLFARPGCRRSTSASWTPC